MELFRIGERTRRSLLRSNLPEVSRGNLALGLP
jgi:hypothetical protein